MRDTGSRSALGVIHGAAQFKVHSSHLAVGLLFSVAGILACMAPVQSDTWWLLRAGQDIWSTGTVPLADAYSHTAADRYWWNHEWLTEALFYGLFRLGGLPLLAAVSAGSILATWLLCWRLSRGGFELRFAVIGASLASMAGAWAVRPQAFSMLLFIVVCALLTDDRRLKWIPAVVLLWVNLHGAAVMALVAIAGAGVGAMLFTRRIPWRHLATFAASFIATGLSPIGFRLYPEILASVERSRINALIEWLPPDATAWLLPFWLLVIAAPATALLRRRHLDDRTARLLGMAILVLPLAVRSTRNVHLFLLVAIPAVTSAWAGPPRPLRRAGEREGVNRALLVATVAAAAVLVGWIWRHPPPRLGWNPISVEAVAAVAGCPAPLYNTYGNGGVLIWFTPSQRVFIDNRQDPYSTELLKENKALEMSGDHEATFDRYGIRCAAVAPDSVIGRRLAADPAWTLLHRDRQWIVLTR